MSITQEELREMFSYREDGRLIRRKRRGVRTEGRVAGTVRPDGYRQLNIAGKFYREHRLVWLWHYGYFPENDLNHIDRKRGNSRIENLREVSRTCSNRNQGNIASNTSGVNGAYFCAQAQSWVAMVKVARKTLHLGYHKDFSGAVCHRLAAEQALDWARCDCLSPASRWVKENITRATNE